MDCLDFCPGFQIDVGEIETVFAGPAPDVVAVREVRDGGEIEERQVIPGRRICVDLGKVILSGCGDRVVSAESKNSATHHYQIIVTRGSPNGFVRMHLKGFPQQEKT